MRFLFGILTLFLVLASFSRVDAQAKRNTRQPAKTETTPSPTPAVTPSSDKAKRNERPSVVKTQAVEPVASTGPRYRYEFDRPDFLVSHIVIEHDDAGKGTIAFKRGSIDEDLTEQITVSPSSLDRLNAAFEALNFINSNESYQFERDFSHLGNIAVTLRKDGRERTAKFNWTTNKDAKALMDEYRRISNQYVWMFDFNLARQNQPLETPKLVESLDGLIKRNEISDPHQMLPFLTALSNDERVPLIGRNKASKIVKQIEKTKN